ncbi:unnamed protein product [Sphagnum tenellum]
MATSNFGSVSFSGQFDVGSDNSSVTEKLKGAVGLRSFSQSLMNTRNLQSRGIGGRKFVDIIGGRDGASKIARSPQFSTLAFSGRLQRERRIGITRAIAHKLFWDRVAMRAQSVGDLTALASKIGEEVLEVESFESCVKCQAGPMVTVEVADVSKAAWKYLTVIVRFEGPNRHYDFSMNFAFRIGEPVQ